ncbi:hypothetical protein AB0D34_31135 [Streptomyces sp. NPDC048420]|uniref:hypothetical protein n=1 Tax=Streptomyces sp. NPDC048420 TaxID=3155755 RepID=UPI00344487C1
MAELEQLGFDNLTGVDTSPEMIRRALSLHPTLRFTTPAEFSPSPASFDAALLFAVRHLHLRRVQDERRGDLPPPLPRSASRSSLDRRPSQG